MFLVNDKGIRGRFGNPRLRDNLVNGKNGTEYILPISLRLQADPLTRIWAIMARLHPGIFIAFHDVRHEAVHSLILRLFIIPASTTSFVYQSPRRNPFISPSTSLLSTHQTKKTHYAPHNANTPRPVCLHRNCSPGRTRPQMSQALFQAKYPPL